jgi:hypothetical protein
VGVLTACRLRAGHQQEGITPVSAPHCSRRLIRYDDPT